MGGAGLRLADVVSRLWSAYRHYVVSVCACGAVSRRPPPVRAYSSAPCGVPSACAVRERFFLIVGNPRAAPGRARAMVFAAPHATAHAKRQRPEQTRFAEIADTTVGRASRRIAGAVLARETSAECTMRMTCGFMFFT